HKPLGHIPISINPPIPQERPMRSAELDLLQIARHDENFFLVDARALDHLSVRLGHEALSPEFDAVFAHGFSVGAEDVFNANAIRRADVTTIRDGVASLDQLP